MTIGRAAPASGASVGRANDLGAALVGGLQFVGVAWIVLNQFRDHPNPVLGVTLGWVAKGYLGAGLYFIAGGYVLMEAYSRLKDEGRFRYVGFLWRRLSFLYPLHLLVLAGFACAVALSPVIGFPLHVASFRWRDLPAHLLVVQAWGFLANDTWNFPSWLISADWFVHIALPALAWGVLRASKPIWPVIGALGLFVALFLMSASRGLLFTDLTTLGALQAVVGAIYGLALWRLGQRMQASPTQAAGLAAFAAAWIAAAAALRVSDIWIWPAFGPLVLGIALVGRSHLSARFERPARWLGELSIAVQLIYLPVDILYFRAVRAFFGAPQGAWMWVALAGIFPVILTAAILACYGVQRPAAAIAQRVGDVPEDMP